MAYRKEYNFKGSPFSAIIGVIVLVLMFMAFFYITQWVIGLLYGAITPILLIATLLLDYKVVTGYFNWIFGLVKRNAVLGIGAILLSLIGYPFVTLFLFGKALLRRESKRVEKETEQEKPGEYIDFEELEERPLDLKKLEKEAPPKRKESDYDTFFDDSETV